MDALLSAPRVMLWRDALEHWFVSEILTIAMLAQLGALALTLALALLLRGSVARWLRADDPALWVFVRRFADVSAALALPGLWLLLLWVLWLAAETAQTPDTVLEGALALLSTWFFLRLLAGLLYGGGWLRAIATVVWVMVALNILGLMEPITATLDRAAFLMGGIRVTALGVIKSLLIAAVALWAAIVLSRLLEDRLHKAKSLTPSLQALGVKLVRVGLVTIAAITALSVLGIDLTAFAVFSGAVGVGVGFGLQKVISNLISGIILLLDRSIKPGDVIEVADTYGWINTLGARYVSVVTRDGMEHLIPNEDLITQRVINWSYSSKQVRLRCPVSVSYDSDVRLAMALVCEAAAEEQRVLEDPAPKCLLLGFGDSAVDLELRFWINDPENGAGNIKSAVLLRVYDKFTAAGVTIPYPHREVIVRYAMDAAESGVKGAPS